SNLVAARGRARYSVVTNVFTNRNPYRTTYFHTNYSVCQRIVKDVFLECSNRVTAGIDTVNALHILH
ncbi:MAG: hypothetical protein AABZ13_09355, partial [Planctomycetota bacterium]